VSSLDSRERTVLQRGRERDKTRTKNKNKRRDETRRDETRRDETSRVRVEMRQEEKEETRRRGRRRREKKKKSYSGYGENFTFAIEQLRREKKRERGEKQRQLQRQLQHRRIRKRKEERRVWSSGSESESGIVVLLGGIKTTVVPSGRPTDRSSRWLRDKQSKETGERQTDGSDNGHQPCSARRGVASLFVYVYAYVFVCLLIERFVRTTTPHTSNTIVSSLECFVEFVYRLR